MSIKIPAIRIQRQSTYWDIYKHADLYLISFIHGALLVPLKLCLHCAARNLLRAEREQHESRKHLNQCWGCSAVKCCHHSLLPPQVLKGHFNVLDIFNTNVFMDG